MREAALTATFIGVQGQKKAGFRSVVGIFVTTAMAFRFSLGTEVTENSSDLF